MFAEEPRKNDFVWNRLFETGITAVDAEHRALVGIVTGCGIPAPNVARIFEPFFTTKPVGQGTGLGLAMSWDIVVNKHHGRLEVTSRVGQGSCFTVWLPRLSAAAD